MTRAHAQTKLAGPEQLPDHWNLNCSCFPQGALQHRRAGMQTAASQGIEQTRARSGSKDHSARRTQGADAKSRHDENAQSLSQRTAQRRQARTSASRAIANRSARAELQHHSAKPHRSIQEERGRSCRASEDMRAASRAAQTIANRAHAAGQDLSRKERTQPGKSAVEEAAVHRTSCVAIRYA